MKSLLVVCLMFLVSCNVMKDIIGGDTDLDQDFFNTDRIELSHELLGFWRLDAAGTSNRFDSSGNGQDLITTGTLLNSTVGGRNSIDCSSVSGSDHLTASVSNMTFNTENDFSVSFWMYFDTTPGGQFTILEMDNLIIRAQSANNADLEFYVNGGNSLTTKNIPFSTTTWYHVVLNLDRDGGYHVYLDGNHVHHDSSQTSAFTASTAILRVCSQVSGTVFFGGKIDSVGVWGRLLNHNEIKRLYEGSYLD